MRVGIGGGGGGAWRGGRGGARGALWCEVGGIDMKGTSELGQIRVHCALEGRAGQMK